MRTVSIIGVGRVGGALAVALGRVGFEVENLFIRSERSAQKAAALVEPRPPIISNDDYAIIGSDVVLIATQDAEIRPVAELLADKLETRPIVFHLSGALSSEELVSLKDAGCPVGSLHPLVSISDPVLGAERFAGARFCVEGDPQAIAGARAIVERLGGVSFSIETRYKTLYHAAAVTACGHFVALIDVAVEMLTKCGLNEVQAKETLWPLIKSTVDNLQAQNVAEALTGTFARADVGTFEKHLAALDGDVSDEAREIYLQLGARSTHLAERQGADADRLAEIRRKISLAKKNFRC